MAGRLLDIEAASHISTTKDILGEHLHQKVQEALAKCMKTSGTIKPGKHGPADKLTGMLLERSEADVLRMLQDEAFLLFNLNLALQSWNLKYPLSNRISDDSLTKEELGEILYDKVIQVEPQLAPQITGMLLELDNSCLMRLVKDEDGLLQVAMKKAKVTLMPVSSLENTANIRCSRPGGEGGDSAPGRSWEKEQTIPEDEDTLRDRIGVVVYEQVLELYPQCPAIVTGMILELDLTTLQQLFDNKELLKTAIVKAYKVWATNT